MTFDDGSSYRFVSKDTMDISDKRDNEARVKLYLFPFFLILLLCHLHPFRYGFVVIAIQVSK